MNFVKSHNVSIAVLLSCLYRLQMVLLDQSFFLFEDIRRTVEEVVQSQPQSTTTAIRSGGEEKDDDGEVKHSGKGEGEGEEEEQVIVVFYTGLVYELCVTPRMSMEGPRLGLLPPFDEAAVSEERLVQWLLQRLVERNEKEEGRYELLMDGMRLEAKKYERYEVLERGKEKDVEEEIASSHSHSHYPHPSNPNVNHNPYPKPVNIYLDHHEDGSISTSKPIYSLSLGDPDAASTTAIERHDAVVRLLAHIRKSGMDIVFPQDLHDRVLLMFYVSVKSAAPLAHRDLMDMILTLKETKTLGDDLASVSKTKLRGILALLKNAHALLATAGQGDSVRLYLGKAVTTFRMFRERHDAFINRCILQQHMFLPLTVKVEVLWQGLDEQSIMDRCDALREFESLVESFIAGRRGNGNLRLFAYAQHQGLGNEIGRVYHAKESNHETSSMSIQSPSLIQSEKQHQQHQQHHNLHLYSQSHSHGSFPLTMSRNFDAFAYSRNEATVLPHTRSSPPISLSQAFPAPVSASSFASSANNHQYMQTNHSHGLGGQTQTRSLNLNHSHNRQTMLHFPGAEDRDGAITMTMDFAPASGSGSHWTRSGINHILQDHSRTGLSQSNHSGICSAASINAGISHQSRPSITRDNLTDHTFTTPTNSNLTSASASSSSYTTSDPISFTTYNGSSINGMGGNAVQTSSSPFSTSISSQASVFPFPFPLSSPSTSKEVDSTDRRSQFYF